MEEKVLIFGHKNPDTDAICSAIVMAEIENKMNGNAESVRLGEVNKETKYALDYFEVQEPKFLESIEDGQKVILVDHNEYAQSVDGIENAKIEKVVDHHRICGMKTAEPLYYFAQPVGCTATVLNDICEMNNIEITKKMAGLMVSAIISDTLLLKSPTCTQKDVKAVEKLAKIAEIDVNNYGLEMLKAGTDLDDFTAKQLINLDAKNLENNGKKFVIAQVNTVDIEDTMKRKKELEEAIKKEIEEKNLELFVLAITDILNSNSQIIVLGKNSKEVIEKAFNKKLENNTAFLEGVVSRKKQLLPNIDKNI